MAKIQNKRKINQEFEIIVQENRCCEIGESASQAFKILFMCLLAHVKWVSQVSEENIAHHRHAKGL